MPVDVNLGFDNAYNARLRKMLYNLENMDVITHNPQLLGGGPVRKYILSGNNGSYPPVEMLAELTQMGGRQRKTGMAKALRTLGRAVKPLGKTLKPVKKAVVERVVRELETDQIPQEMPQEMPQELQAGKISRMKKAKKWTDFAENTAYKALAVANAAKTLGGKVSRMKKAKKWTDFAENTAYKALSVANAAKTLGGKVSRMKKAEKWRDFGENTAYRTLAVANAAKSLGGAKPKRAPSARAAIVKKVMAERGVNMINASKIVKSEGLY